MTRSIPPFGPPFIVCGIEELGQHSHPGASHVLSILDPDHPVPEAFGTYGEHAKLELRFHDIIDPSPGQVLPAPEHVDAILAFGRTLKEEPEDSVRLLVHCHAGISRSTASIVLILAQAMPEVPADTILRLVQQGRPQAWPNLRLIEMGDGRLRRDGSLVAATTALHRRQLIRLPHLAAMMAEAGRQREIAAARI